MKRKIAFLITGCIFTVMALAIIQGYFIYNTYLLRAKEANQAITQQLLKLETTGKLDTLNNTWMGKTRCFADLYYDKKVSKKDYIKLIKKTEDSLSKVISEYIKKERFFEGYDVTFANYLISVGIYTDDEKKADNLFSGKMLLFGNNPGQNPETQASQSTWHGDSEKKFNFVVVTERYYSISNWEKEIFIKMSGLLIFSVVLLTFVVLLFYLSIKNLITQKKIADIKTDFINNITHEFQTPIAALDIAIKTLRKKEGDISAEHFNHSLDIIERQNVRMQKLFRQVSEASINEEIIPDNILPSDCNSIKEVVTDFKLSYPSVQIECNAKPDTVLHIDKFHLATILVNLLDNAIKYGADSITVTLSNGKLTVNDNGIGIPKKEQKAIFEKFYRIQKGDIHTTKGLGLGLYYVHQLIKAYNGTVTVNSEENKGAEFIISIPQP
ncbi:sensor histidine kinase KdpD [Flavobacterium sp. NRK1]|uniref:sensor histidine kinase n=1 Tax=Flavobacterium sp. NRK1 TaxID=2954929 RepID=UPI002093E91C|nr:HAMP domain-containing sensor histidine kinase [Flavobacterium sp. NRK1]MCO6148200.1 HAMP domain-containing histidine kinase [Flavobacterium sp. NRK1]